jgi:hypothetical protein
MTNTYQDSEAYTNQCVDLNPPVPTVLPQEQATQDEQRIRKAMRTSSEYLQHVGIPMDATVRKYFPVVELVGDGLQHRILQHDLQASGRPNAKRMGKSDTYARWVKSSCVGPTSRPRARQSGGARRSTRLQYKITAVSGDTIQLDDELSLPIEAVRRHFIHNYCRTCHSFRG